MKRDNPATKDMYTFDFIAYHRKDLNWLAFLTILFLENSGLILIDNYIIFPQQNIKDNDGLKFPLRDAFYLLWFNHLLQIVFLRHLYDEDRRVNRNHRLVWVINAISYTYVIYKYFFTDLINNESS